MRYLSLNMSGVGSGDSPCRRGRLPFFILRTAGLGSGEEIAVHTAGYARKTAFFLMEKGLTLIYNK